MTLDTLLAPHSAAEFLSRVLGQAAWYVDGNADKFEAVLSWAVLNRLLEFGGLSYPRLRMFNGAHSVEDGQYLAPGRSRYPRPVPEQVSALLRGGATLAIEAVEELHEPVWSLCADIEQIIRVPVAASLYASCHAGPAGTLRWNDHEAFVLQVDGAKAWQVFCPTTQNATLGNPPPEPTGGPAWEGVLRAGDVLYIPKSWWYSDPPNETRSLALGLSFRNPTGIDILDQVCERLSGNSWFHQDLPRFGSSVSQSAFLASFHDELHKASTHPGLLLGFLTTVKMRDACRSYFHLPTSADFLPMSPAKDAVVVPLLRFPNVDALRHLEREDGVAIWVNGRQLLFHEDVTIILQRSFEAPSPTVAQVVEYCAPPLSSPRVLELLGDLIARGVLSTQEVS